MSAQGIDPIAASDSYASKHFAPQLPPVSERVWLVEDHGDYWTVEINRRGQVGGGVQMSVREARR